MKKKTFYIGIGCSFLVMLWFWLKHENRSRRLEKQGDRTMNRHMDLEMEGWI